jgi:predicted DNA-binding protein (UPF0251 family)
MVSIFRKKEANEPCLSVEEPLVILRALEKEEVSLMEEKRELLALKDKLQLKANEKIEIMRLRTQTLKSDISELRRQCEELEKIVSSTNNSQTTSIS